jgi:hypothetical protein
VKRARVLFFAAFAFLSTAHADDGTARVTVRESSFLASQPYPVEQHEVNFTADYDRRLDVREGIGFQFHPYLYGTSVQDRRQQSVVLDPRAFYVEFDPKFAWLRMGYMTMKWEGTDGLNPMDVASMKDWSDPLLTETRASGAVAIGRSGDKYDLELAYIPYQTLWLLPGTKSPWLPRRLLFPIRTDEFELRLPDRVEYVFENPVELNDARLNNVASRVQLRSSIADVSVGYYEGLADSPALEPVLDVTQLKAPPHAVYQLLSPVHITPVAYKVRTVSGLLSRPFGQWIFRASSRYDQPLGSDKRLPDWSQESVIGFERSFDIGTNTWTAVLQGAWTRAPESASLISVRDIFNQTVLFGLRAPIGEKWTTMLSGFKTTRDSSYYAKAEAGYRFSDHWRVDGSLELLDGPAETLLGVFGGNDRVMLSMSGIY